MRPFAGVHERNAKGRPWQDNAYMGAKMVFRRIPAGKFTMGYTPEQFAYLESVSPTVSPPLPKITAHEVEISSDYYIAVYPSTRDQVRYMLHADYSGHDSYAAFHGHNTITELLEAGGGAICFIRGSNTVDNIKWPTTKFKVKDSTWVGRMRDRSGRRLMFDLATAAQWQKAARPDADVLWYRVAGEDGTDGGKIGDSTEAITNVLKVISQVPTAVATSYSQPGSVGMYAPNSYGLYDTVVARPEWVLDQYSDATVIDSSQTVDPVGLNSKPGRCFCLGAFVQRQSILRWSMCVPEPNNTTVDHAISNVNNMMPFRFAIHLKPPRCFDGKWE